VLTENEMQKSKYLTSTSCDKTKIYSVIFLYNVLAVQWEMLARRRSNSYLLYFVKTPLKWKTNQRFDWAKWIGATFGQQGNDVWGRSPLISFSTHEIVRTTIGYSAWGTFAKSFPEHTTRCNCKQYAEILLWTPVRRSNFITI